MKEPDIYEDTCLHPITMTDKVVGEKYRNIDEKAFQEVSRWLERRLINKYRDCEKFREKLLPCKNGYQGPDEEADKIRDWILETLLPSWLPNSLEERQEAITVWPFDNAPKALKEHASQGGDEDWLVILPPLNEQYGLPHWIEAMDSLREPRQVDHPTKPGWQLYVGTH